MAHVHFLDETLRDGQQSLWGFRMQAKHALPAAPYLDRAGFHTIDLTGSSHFEVLIRYCLENPWDTLDLMVDAMPRTRLRAGMRSNASVTFSVTPDALMDCWMRRLCAHGIRSMWIYDVLFNIDKMLRLARIAKERDVEVAGALMFALSPVHTDAYYADKARQLAASPHVDTLLLYDTGGVLTPERLRTLLPGIVAVANGKPIEFHSNNILGQSALAYLAAIDLGVSILHTACRPLANGPSVPSIQIMAHNVEVMGHTHDIDTSRLPPVEAHLEAVARATGFATGHVNEYDALAVQHQIPGGMIGSFRAQLVQHGMADRLDAVLREAAVVRRELGYPTMATPFSQLVGTLAVLHVATGKRYAAVPDEVIQYAAGWYGEPVAPIEPTVLDRIWSASNAAQFRDRQPPQPTLDELKREHGTDDDDELLLRALVPASDIERMRAAGPIQTEFPLLSSPELDAVRRFMRSSGARLIEIETQGLSLNLRRR